jgi:hypothetical protein
LLCKTEKVATKSWAKKVTPALPNAHGLIALLASLLWRTTCDFSSTWLAGSLNETANFCHDQT